MVSRILAVGIVVLIITIHSTSGDDGLGSGQKESISPVDSLNFGSQLPTSCPYKIDESTEEPKLMIQETVGEETVYKLFDDELEQVLYRRPRSEAGHELITFQDPDTPQSLFVFFLKKVKEIGLTNEGTPKYLYLVARATPTQMRQILVGALQASNQNIYREPNVDREMDESDKVLVVTTSGLNLNEVEAKENIWTQSIQNSQVSDEAFEGHNDIENQK